MPCEMAWLVIVKSGNRQFILGILNVSPGNNKNFTKLKLL